MSLLWYNHPSITAFPNKNAYPGLEAWSAIYSIFREMHGPRTGVRAPISLTYDAAVDPPTRGLARTFEDCCMRRAESLLTDAETSHRPLVLMFSGGIDSTTIATTFLRFFPLERLKVSLRIATSTESWVENPHFVRTHLIGTIPFISNRTITDLCDGSAIILTGEMNDYYIPNSQLQHLSRLEGGASAPYSAALTRTYLEMRGMDARFIPRWTEVIDAEVRNAPVPLPLFADVLWWIRFNWSRQSYKFIPFIGMGAPTAITTLKAHDDRIRHFFDSPDFAQWGMINTDRSPRKNHCRALIATLFEDAYWISTKQKYNSLGEMFKHRAVPCGIDDSFSIVRSTKELLTHYRADNDFIVP